MNDGTKFTVRIENVSSADGQVAKDGTKWPFALSPGLWVVHEREVRLERGIAHAGHQLISAGGPGVLLHGPAVQAGGAADRGLRLPGVEPLPEPLPAGPPTLF
jgi:hypothetical protein